MNTLELLWAPVVRVAGTILKYHLQTEEKKVRKKLSGGRYLMLETRKDGTKFTSRGLKEAAERLQGISRSYDQRQHALVEQVRACSNCVTCCCTNCNLNTQHVKRTAEGSLL